ncbi:Sterol 3-beta-glucosyltransferase UGT80A2 [Colletotrichum fructicola]|nr:Sterol 3-beta-glucosyltransferase UGT80A2 [Colletotrichum fructicola]KAF4887991.1 Sterol 3-beta-glucosyltransferase UGT80A2 [Colletotrichum fructicola]KAF4934784.1 Sterol 3-beta-glucosyltransferase UGT80A2 [Colletotrichum fructicola]
MSADEDDNNTTSTPPPPLRVNVVILFMGSRGDLQPSIAIAKALQRSGGRYRVRVRIATHPPYRAAVEAAGVGFYSAGARCDIKRMMARRLLPREELKREVPEIEREFGEMGARWWGACVDGGFLQAMKAVINATRRGMGLEDFSPAWWLSQFNRLRVPCTYLWSPLLLPKPSDWASNISVAGFALEDVSEGDFVPPPDLVKFLEKGPQPPVYVGFGSMTFANAADVFGVVRAVVREMGLRVVVCRGWSGVVMEEGVGEKGEEVDDVFVVDDVPHAWLFPRVRAVVCHGGAGTVAIALRCGRPTLVVPVAGDQPFWGSRVAEVGCGPAVGFGIAQMTKDGLRGKLGELLEERYAVAAGEFGRRVRAERDGVEGFREDLERSLEVYEGLRCAVLRDRVGVWRVGGVLVSAVAAEVLMREGRVKWEELRAVEAVRWGDLVAPGDPVSGLVMGVKGVGRGVRKDVQDKAWAFVVLHVIRAPLMILAGLTFGMFNFVDFILWKMASPTEPKLYASNPRLYGYGQMLGFLVAAPWKELQSIAYQPAELTKGGRGVGRVILEAPLAILRVLVALVNILVGFVGISLRMTDLACSKAMGERDNRDVVAEARLRQGRIEADELAIERTEEGGDLTAEVLRAWDAKS